MYRSRRVVSALAACFLAVAVGQFLLALRTDETLLEATIDLLLIALPGVLLFAVGGWLSRTGLDSDAYQRVVGWSLAGVGVMAVFLVLRAAHPGVDASLTFGTRAIAIAIGSVGGLAVGIREAQALTHARELQRRNDQLDGTRAALARRNRELERARRDLEAAVRELERSNERLEEFAHAATHDLRSPLRTITGSLHLLERAAVDDLDEDARDLVEEAGETAGRMAETLEGLLEYARLDGVDGDFEPVELSRVVGDVLDDLGAQLEERDAVVDVRELPTVYGDERQLRQVVQNLVANAVDYSEDAPRVRVSAAADDDVWTVSVADEGVGVDPAHRQRIFEPFERAHGSGEGGGSGIGLALCRRVVERHGGEIWVDSDPGEGSTFSFTLPRPGTATRDRHRASPGPA